MQWVYIMDGALNFGSPRLDFCLPSFRFFSPRLEFFLNSPTEQNILKLIKKKCKRGEKNLNEGRQKSNFGEPKFSASSII